MPLPRTATKKPFDIPVMFRRIERAVAGFAKAAMFELAERGFATVFQQLVGCMISIRTRDEVSLPTAIALLEVAPTPEAMQRLSVARIDRLIAASTFHEAKAKQIAELAHRAVAEYGGELPCDSEVLQSFSGVGPKCAHLTLGVACGATEISVDVHVGRVTARWGYVEPGNPDKIRQQLEGRLPKRYWVDINRLLVPFGKHICTGRLPKCSTCPVLAYCRQVGVVAHR